MNNNPLSRLAFYDVRNHYFERKKIGVKLRALHEAGAVDDYVDLALGISDPRGNYSASDHDLGPKILNAVPSLLVFNLAKTLQTATDSKTMLLGVYAANIPNLKVSVGSEMAMLLRPRTFWVANTRTVWAHLLIKHDFNYEIANEELALYRHQDSSSEMEYRKWREIYSLMKPNMLKVGQLGDSEAANQKVKAGKVRPLWFDALSNALYERRAG